MTSPYITTGGYDDYHGGLNIKFESDAERLIFAIVILFILYWIYKYFICGYYPTARPRPLMLTI